MMYFASSVAAGMVAGLLMLPNALAAQPTQQPYRDWTAAYAAANAAISLWTVQEQSNISVRNGKAPGYSYFNFSDGPNGVSGGAGVSGWVNAQTLASSWDTDLLNDHHSAMAAEFAKKGYTLMGAPTVGPLGRSVYGGRLFEGLSTDPYLSGILMAEAVTAIQKQNVISCGKHYILNEQETDRTGTGNNRTSSNLDDRTFHELYLWPWMDGVNAGMGSVMCSMNRINGTDGCQNAYSLGILKNQTGFLGFVVPDVTVPVNATAGLLNGLDWNSGLNLAQITALIANGSIPASTMTDHALRIVATMYNYLLPASQYPTSDAAKLVNARDPKSTKLIRSAGSQSIVLLKNTRNALPLQSGIASVGVFGLDAGNLGTGPVGGRAGLLGFSFQGDTYPSHLVSGGGSAQSSDPWITSPLDALTQRAAVGAGFNVYYVLSDNSSVTTQASASQACLVFINAYAAEGADRRDLAVLSQDQLVLNVAGQCNNTVVILNNAGARLVDRWIGHANVTAVLNAGLLGEQSGNSIMDVIFGDVNPSGKLVYTIAKNESDYNGQICPCCECDYTEGLYIDYKHFDQANIEPRYEFGFGLSYTTFQYSDLKISTSFDKKASAYATGKIVEGGPKDLFDNVVTVTATIGNTGSVEGAEVAQLYLGLPAAANAPVRQLRGFQKLSLKPGQSKTATFKLRRRDLSFWDTAAQAWKMESGTYNVMVGASSRNLILNGTLQFQAAS